MSIHAAAITRSDRLRRVHALLARGGWHTTMSIIRHANVAAVNSIISELRAGGAVIICKRAHVRGAGNAYHYKMQTPIAGMEGRATDVQCDSARGLVAARNETMACDPRAPQTTTDLQTESAMHGVALRNSSAAWVASPQNETAARGSRAPRNNALAQKTAAAPQTASTPSPHTLTPQTKPTPQNSPAAKPAPGDERRRKFLAAIHATAKQKNMPDAERRELFRRRIGKDSCRDMTNAELGGALALVREWQKPRHMEPLDANADKTAARLRAKITAQCTALDLHQNYANGIARRMFRTELAACDATQLRAVVSALAVKQRRARNAGEVNRRGEVRRDHAASEFARRANARQDCAAGKVNRRENVQREFAAAKINRREHGQDCTATELNQRADAQHECAANKLERRGDAQRANAQRDQRGQKPCS